jgi:hypothetical protein
MPKKRVSEQNDGKPNRQRIGVQFPEQTEPILGKNQGDSGTVPDLNHSDGVPMTDNTRPPRKSRVIFDK